MEQLTLEQAAYNYAIYKSESRYETNFEAFKAGAEWQKEQYKELLHLYGQTLAAFEIRYPEAKQLLVGYTNQELFNKIATLESLQD